jgi:hypothetical protein
MVQARQNWSFSGKIYDFKIYRLKTPKKRIFLFLDGSIPGFLNQSMTGQDRL